MSQSETTTINVIERAIMLGAKDKPMELDFHQVGDEVVVRVPNDEIGYIEVGFPKAEAKKLGAWLARLKL